MTRCCDAERGVGSLHWWYKPVATCRIDMAYLCVVMQVTWIYWNSSRCRGWFGRKNEHTRVLAVKPPLPRCAGGAGK